MSDNAFAGHPLIPAKLSQDGREKAEITIRGDSISGEQIVAGVNILDEIARVLDIEIEALRSVRQNISPGFVRAVEMIAACRGQVLVSGIGKSGIIGTKIAATLRSTGTPARR